MRIVMAVSRDGYMARHPEDRMEWLGSTDKAVFRILTGVYGCLAVGRRTAAHIPDILTGRDICVLSTQGRVSHATWGTLEEFHDLHPDGWLIGGPTLASIALESGIVDEVHLCRSERHAFPDLTRMNFVLDSLTPYLEAEQFKPLKRHWWKKELETKVLDVTVECWRRHTTEYGPA